MTEARPWRPFGLLLLFLLLHVLNQVDRSLIASFGPENVAELDLTRTQFRIESGLEVYFCDPQSPWQRGSNENTNGLLRQYFPKGTDLSRHSTGELAAVAHAMNTRPRKTLGWKTPIEVLNQFLAQQYNAHVATTG